MKHCVCENALKLSAVDFEETYFPYKFPRTPSKTRIYRMEYVGICHARNHGVIDPTPYSTFKSPKTSPVLSPSEMVKRRWRSTPGSDVHVSTPEPNKTRSTPLSGAERKVNDTKKNILNTCNLPCVEIHLIFQAKKNHGDYHRPAVPVNFASISLCPPPVATPTCFGSGPSPPVGRCGTSLRIGCKEHGPTAQGCPQPLTEGNNCIRNHDFKRGGGKPKRPGQLKTSHPKTVPYLNLPLQTQIRIPRETRTK